MSKRNIKLVIINKRFAKFTTYKLEIHLNLFLILTKSHSGAFGIGKPDASIFQHVLAESGVTADEAMMVGDNLMTDILGASRVGMRSVWINREKKLPSEEVVPTYEIDHLEKYFLCLKS